MTYAQRPSFEANLAEISGLPDACFSTSIRTTNAKLIAACRLGVGAEGLKDMLEHVQGIGVTAPTAEETRLIDSDRFRLSSIAKRKPAPRHAEEPPTVAGELTVYDGWGPHNVPSALNGHTYQMHQEDGYSGVGGLKDTTSHTADDFFSFVKETTDDLRAAGFEPKRVRFDQASELRAIKQRVETELHLGVEYAPSKYHEGVSRNERSHDTVTRMAEAMVQRASLGPAYMLAARRLARLLLNMRRRRKDKTSRLGLKTGNRPSLAKMPIPIFGCDVLVLREKEDR
jgi:hypothetical protein